MFSMSVMVNPRVGNILECLGLMDIDWGLVALAAATTMVVVAAWYYGQIGLAAVWPAHHII